MSEKLPIFDEIDACVDKADVARWLLAVPLSILLSYQTAIINRCRNRHFLDGVQYVDLVVAALRMRRDQAGDMCPAALDHMANACALMAGTIASDAAKRRDVGEL